MGRKPCCSKVGLNRGAWTATEDKILKQYIEAHGEGQWRDLPKKAGLSRCGKSCRLRWLNYLRPDIKRGNITEDEEELIIRLHKLLGNRWSLIAGRLPGRTDNEIKNYWNTNVVKKLQQQKSSCNFKHPFKKNVHQPPTETTTDPQPSVYWTKATRCTKVCIPQRPYLSNDQIETNQVVNGVAGDDHSNQSDFMMGLEMDDNFLAEFLDSNFLQECELYNTWLEPTNLSTDSSQALEFSDQEKQLLHESNLQSTAYFLESEIDWTGIKLSG